MQNRFLELSSSPLMNLDHTKRYSGTKLVEEETLSQHIVDTIMMGLKIIDHINWISEETVLDIKKYIMKAVYHDLEESITGDIPRPLKYYNEATQQSLKDVADIVAKNFFEREFDYYTIDAYSTWETAKDGREGYILKLVDTLVVANKVVKEVTLLNNLYMLRVAHEVSTYLTDQHHALESKSPFESRVTEYLLEIVLGAIHSMRNILETHKECMEDLDIYGQSMI